MLIGVDPHKMSVTIEVVDTHERLLGRGRFDTTNAGYAAMRRYVKQGHRGVTLQSSAADSHPLIDTSDQQLPGPANPTLRPPPADVKNLVPSTG